jgi:hypothetical protein
MKTTHSPLLALAAMLGFTMAAQAAVIVDDTWATGSYTNWSLPDQSPWYYNASGGNLYYGCENNSLILTNYGPGVTGTRNFWTYFTTNDPAMTAVYGDGSVTNSVSNTTNSFYGQLVDIGVGQQLTVTLRFIPSGFLYNDIGAKGLRMGLMGYGTNAPTGRATRNTTNISKSGTNVTGYLLEIPLCLNWTNNPVFDFRVRTNLNGMADSIDPLGKTSTYFTLGAGPRLTNVTAFTLDQEYTLHWSVERWATANRISADISGPLAGVASTNFSRSYTDTSGTNGNWHAFDHFQFRVDSSVPVTDRLILKEFKVETSPLPPFNITTAHPIDANNFRLIWDSLTGQKYRVESKDDLNAASWTSNVTITATGTSTTWTNTGLSAISDRFYRVVNTP